MAAEQQEKLASLKKWIHYDAMDRQSMKALETTILYPMAWNAWDEAKGPEARNGKKAKLAEDGDMVEEEEDIVGGLEEVEGLFDLDDSMGSTPEGKKQTTSSNEIEGKEDDRSDDDDEPMTIPVRKGLKRKTRKAIESSGESDGEEAKSDEEEDGPTTTSAVSSSRSRSSTTTASLEKTAKVKDKGKGGAVKGKGKALHGDNGGMRHNLVDIAAKGGGGRIMYVFERVSGAQPTK
jgi:hypothetical protein